MAKGLASWGWLLLQKLLLLLFFFPVLFLTKAIKIIIYDCKPHTTYYLVFTQMYQCITLVYEVIEIARFDSNNIQGMTEKSFEIPKQMGKVLLVIAGMNLQMHMAGREVQKLRKSLFNQPFMNSNFGQLHKAEFKEHIQPNGHPDNGAGLYSQKLSYRDWYRLNVLQRIYLNYQENINLATTATIAAGLYSPKFGVGVGVTYMIGRLLYSFFYKQQHGARNKGRIAGILVCHAATVAGIVFFLKKLLQ